MLNIPIQKTAREIAYDRLMSDEPLTFEEIQNLELFNDHYIVMLLGTDQQTIKSKIAEALTRDGMTEVKAYENSLSR